jgi:hypothetical protein
MCTGLPYKKNIIHQIFLHASCENDGSRIKISKEQCRQPS